MQGGQGGQESTSVQQDSSVQPPTVSYDTYCITRWTNCLVTVHSYTMYLHCMHYQLAGSGMINIMSLVIYYTECPPLFL